MALPSHLIALVGLGTRSSAAASGDESRIPKDRATSRTDMYLRCAVSQYWSGRDAVAVGRISRCTSASASASGGASCARSPRLLRHRRTRSPARPKRTTPLWVQRPSCHCAQYFSGPSPEAGPGVGRSFPAGSSSSHARNEGWTRKPIGVIPMSLISGHSAALLLITLESDSVMAGCSDSFVRIMRPRKWRSTAITPRRAVRSSPPSRRRAALASTGHPLLQLGATLGPMPC
eukprot:4171368-Prymnesium_polylepis.1